MDPKLDRQLCERFPSIFRDRGGSPHDTCMCLGFPGDGWFQLIWNLCEHLEEDNPEVVAFQVKEKFGGLRFYVRGVNERGRVRIDAAESASYCLCEWCGRAGTTRGSEGWPCTLCLECRAKKKTRDQQPKV